MQFRVDPLVFSLFPDLAIGIIVTLNLDNTGALRTEPLLREAEEQTRRMLDAETFKDHPHLVAMQEVHRSFGNNPNTFPPSMQALLKRVLKGGNLPVINPLVDLYNVISLRNVVCVGAEDIDMCEGDIRLSYADGTEAFVPLGKEGNDPPIKGELVYKDDAGVICRKLNWREGDRSKITDITRNAVIVVEGFPPVSQDALRGVLEELADLVREHCGGELRVEVLSRTKDCTTLS